MPNEPPSKFMKEYGFHDAPPVVAPDGVPIVRPFKELTHFWPNDQAEREDVSWVLPYEVRYLKPLGDQIANIFRVSLINDDEYISMPEEAKATQISCVLTRSELRESAPGQYNWNPLCVVVKYMVMVAVNVTLDHANNKIEITKALVWSNAQGNYVPVFDERTGKIGNPAVLLQVLERYARIERLV